jgi:hypothetical protein
VAGRAGKDGGVKVERPEPQARTYDLEATVGRRTLVGDDVVSVQLSTGSAPVFASGPSGWRWLRWAGWAARHLFVPWLAHDAIEAVTTVGLNQFDDAAGVAPGVMPFVELAIGGRVRTVMPPRRAG